MDFGQIAGGIALIVAAYFAGAVPSGVVLGRLFGGGVDLRGYGSGSIGTTNALRVFGWRISTGVLLMDLLKGALPVVAGRLLDLPTWAVAFAAVAATVGHCWSVFIKGSGGKGVATGGAAAIALTPWALLTVPVLVIIVATTRYVSLASVVVAGLLPVFFVVLALLGVLSWWGRPRDGDHRGDHHLPAPGATSSGSGPAPSAGSGNGTSTAAQGATPAARTA